MRFKFLILLCALLLVRERTHAQFNWAPAILGQSPISTDENVPVTIAFESLTVIDLNDPYPDGFSMNVRAGSNYTVNERVVSPRRNFNGTLIVPVSVNDGQDDSNVYNVRVNVREVENIEPVIISSEPLSTLINTPIALQLADLGVTDPDNVYPDDFTLKVFNGPHYRRTDNIVTPDAGFTGQLNVRVRVDDGEDESDDFNVPVTVAAVANEVPVIKGQVALSTPQGTPLILSLNNLTVEDPDNTYPTDFTMTAYAGDKYTFSGLTITPDASFSGELTVPVTVNDGTTESAVFDLKITVTPVNAKPVINGQMPLTTVSGTPITLQLANLTVTDADDPYPTGFTMTAYAGANYSFSGLTISPDAGFTGTLTVPVSVNDGEIESDQYSISITVQAKPNAKPEITGQDPLSTFIATPITLALTNFRVTDGDNVFPNDFTLKVYPGVGYSFSGTTITPNLLFIGTLTVPVTVSDGTTESDKFDAKIQVTIVPNVAPTITGQNPLQVVSGNSIAVKLSDLLVTDPDDTYPTGFSLKLYSGANYTFSGATVTPAVGFTGKLTVPVSVNDGEAESGPYNLEITVTDPVNVPPTITDQIAVETNEDTPVAISLNMLIVSDSDNPGYPAGFTLKLLPIPSNGHYTLDGNIVTPDKDYNGTLLVAVAVNDGKADSPPYNLRISVKPVNDAPVLAGQKVLTTFVMTPITIDISDLIITDVDGPAGSLSFRVVTGPNYTFTNNTVTPAANFKGELKVNIALTDGSAITNAQVSVRVNDAPNVPPVIEGQDPNPFITTQNTPLTIELTKLIVTDPDNKFPNDFKLTVRNGANYTVSGTVITPANNFLGTLQVPVVVNDGTDNSAPFTVNVNVVAPSAKPIIIGQKSLVMNEDETLAIKLEDLFVTDTDDVYPIGFRLDILSGPGYTYSGTSVTPARNLNGFLVVSVKVTDDDGKSSDPYGLAILINPVDDAPVIIQFETAPLSYEPGDPAIGITSTFDVEDVDNDYLSNAEVAITKATYTKGYDELLFTNTATIRGIFDADSGKLVLLGYATIAEYRDAVRSVKYQYALDPDEIGKPQALPGNKMLTVLVHDGQLPSERRSREIIMETSVDLRIPAAFSPNADEVNETWQVVALSNPQQCENAVVRVYDKRGVLLFESLGIEKQWDGVYNGALLPTDTYYYTVDLHLSYTKRTYKGSVVLLR